MASTSSDALRLSSNTTGANPRPSPAAQKAAEMANARTAPSKPLGAAAEVFRPAASPAARAMAASPPAASAAASGASPADAREMSMLRNENRRLTAELKAAQLSLSAARKERDLSRDESRKVKEQMRQQGAAGGGPRASGGADSFGAINRADGSAERADRAVLDSLSPDDLRSILAAREAELGSVKIRWADSETEKELQEHKVRRVKKMLHKVGIERDSLARRVTDLEVKLAERR
eukprot:TRINITY_DN4889_c0_g1_i1.p1 TRINITY_DN4889_c0_g1~~TRINITY_DN4889_c0_g1_i1.p1  ORF type:complete len:235 (+),score=61.40 TRINITY_DN4889_c0_g1_i1:178-882(+)